MGWVKNEFENRSEERQPETHSVTEERFESREQSKWQELAKGLEQDAKEFSRLDGSADFSETSEFQCRIANNNSGIAALITADLPAHTIRYAYEPEKKNTAVPEGGLLSLRRSDQKVDLYSADQLLTPQQARRLILEPLLFPPIPTEAEGTGT